MRLFVCENNGLSLPQEPPMALVCVRVCVDVPKTEMHLHLKENECVCVSRRAPVSLQATLSFSPVSHQINPSGPIV